MRLEVFAFSLTTAALAIGCSSSSSLSSSSDASTADAGASIAVPSGAKVTYKVIGGYFADRNDGGACQIYNETYTFDSATNSLSWSACAYGQTGVTELMTGNRVLNASDTAELQGVLGSLQSFDGHCSTDAATESLTIDSAGATSTYYVGGDYCPHDAFQGFKSSPALLDELVKLAGLTGLEGTTPNNDGA